MSLNISFIDPTETNKWDNFIHSFPAYSFFHTSVWAKVLMRTYNYRPHYLLAEEGENPKAALPLMEVNSWLTGSRAVSLPFSDDCEPLVSSDVGFKEILDLVIDHCKKKKLNYLEIRGGSKFFDNVLESTFSYNHILDLTFGEEQIFKKLSSNTERNIKKAIRNKVSVDLSNSYSALEEFYIMNCITRKKHGLPPQPLKFFRNLYDFVLHKNKGIVIIGRYNGKSIAGAVYLLVGEKALYKYGASLFEYQDLRANNLVMWEAIKYFTGQGFNEFSFGRTESENVGLRRFKNGWGVKEQIINYYRYDLRKNDFIKTSTNTSEFKNQMFRRIPLPALKIIGSAAYRHFG
jgi:hypothetical protein